MNSYIIGPAHPSYLDLIKAYASIKQEGSGRKPSKEAAPGIISSREAFEAESFKSLFKSPADTDTIFIVPELNWGNDHSFLAGYKVAEELITQKLSPDSFVNIIFVSGLSRELLSKMHAKTEYAGLVQSFPHMTLDELQLAKEGRKPVSLPLYSRIHFEMLRRVVVSKSGKLDFIKHKLAHLTRIEKGDPEKEKAAIKSAKERLAGFLNLLSLPSYCDKDSPLFPKIQQYQKSLDKADSKEAIHELETGVRNLIDDIRTQMLKDTAASPNESDQVYKVLVVDDDAFFRAKMAEFFKKHLGPKTEVVAYDNAELMGSSVPGGKGKAVKDARTRIVKEVGQYNIVILDMMYTSDGEDNSPLAPFNGFDLYEALRNEEMMKNARKAAVRVITALPRNDVSRMVKSCLTVEPPVVFTKGNDWEQLEGCLRDRMDEILKECKKNEDSFVKWRPFPKRGIFRHPGMYEAIDANKDKFKDACMFAWDVVAGEKKLSGKNGALTVKKDPEELLGHLGAIMAHRRLVIKFLSSENVPVRNGVPYYDEDKYRDFIKKYLTGPALNKNQDFHYDKGYISTKLGFSFSPLPDVNRGTGVLSVTQKISHFTCVIDLDDFFQFFPAELTLPVSAAAAPKALLKYIRRAKAVLGNSRVQTDYKVSDTYQDSGINDFLAGNGSVDSLKQMLLDVKDYLDSSAKFHLKNSLQNVFVEFLDLEDIEPDEMRRDTMFTKEIADLVKQIVGARL